MLCAGLWTVQTWPVTGPFRPPRDRRLRPVAGWLRSWAGCSWAGSACSPRADRPPRVRLRTRGFLGAASLTAPSRTVFRPELSRPELSRPEPSLAPGRRVAGDRLRPVSPRSSSSSASRPCRPPRCGRAKAQSLVDELPPVHVAPVDEGHRDAAAPRPGGPADPVQVGLLVFGALVVHHVGDVVDVEAAGRDLRGDEHVDLSVPDRPRGALTLALT